MDGGAQQTSEPISSNDLSNNMQPNQPSGGKKITDAIADALNRRMAKPILALAVVVVTGAALFVYSSQSQTHLVSTTSPNMPASGTVTSASIPKGKFSHVFLILMENKDDASINSSTAPYTASLESSYGYASNYHAVGLPSLPNYLGLTGGSTFGHSSDCLVSACPVTSKNIADELESAGYTWKAYMESMGNACSTVDTTSYRQKHNPFVYYTDVYGNTSRCSSHDVDYNNLAADLSNNTADYSFITPNMTDDMHSGTVAQGDSWLKSNVPPIMNSAAYKSNGLLVIVWDSALDKEGTATSSPAILISPLSKQLTSTTKETHYSLLRSIEDNFGLPYLGKSSTAVDMSEYFN